MVKNKMNIFPFYKAQVAISRFYYRHKTHVIWFINFTFYNYFIYNILFIVYVRIYHMILHMTFMFLVVSIHCPVVSGNVPSGKYNVENKHLLQSQ
jgi:hypothetical protein